MTKTMDAECLVIGCGFAGGIIARELAERGGRRVLLLEKRDHIGGNAYDCIDQAGVLIHRYGPHIFHSNSRRVYEYLSRFTAWRPYEHKVVCSVYGKYLPVPFNLNSLDLAFEAEKASRIEGKLTETYGRERKVPILELRRSADPELTELADYVYRNVFLYYTQKQWGTTPEETDPEVTARVPIFISRDDRYFQDRYQGIPAEGYTALFERLLDHPNIELRLKTDALDLLRIDGGRIFFDGKPFSGTVVYTGPADELLGCRFGRLPYRTLDFQFETYPETWFQTYGTVNYTVDEAYTRITEFKYLTGQKLNERTTIVKEFSRAYTGAPGETPYYAVNNPDSASQYEKYSSEASGLPDFYLLGRLAEYKYYNMDAIAEKALLLGDRLIAQGGIRK
ncbi:UDP-galactopyranose mutase [Papillibacter cinnamivorans]|uniref:UDP-galactopyranose mutase n=1 Tax=Papillibacter cinnamivorans DSM 12816 TaxID=1122930 RepID=A0A1W2BU88_9FIRM|nr:UDP-galactopyranose mutase [Papillibacter cinnamivorans]SMC76523.1 UDP-galactopyranose mutase [Papillibacter cinnamivorans DSM 12816]